jgi:hypothetical protein
VSPIRFSGVADYCGDIAKKARLQLSAGRAGEVIAGIGLLDLYGLDRVLSFPAGISSPEQRWDWAKRSLEKEVDHPNFRQYFAVHETEAWLLADIGIFPPEVRKDLAAGSRAPEHVNFNNPPARLVMRAYRERLRRRYQKAVDGPNLFRQLDPSRAAAKCPFLKSMLDDVLTLARSATV